MKLYLFFIHKDIIPTNIRYSGLSTMETNISIDDDYLLYAYTKKKEFYKRFRLERKDIFNIKIITMTKEEYKVFQYQYSGLKLDIHTFMNLTYGLDILSTGNEYYVSKKEWLGIIPKVENFRYLIHKYTELLTVDNVLSLSLLGLDTLVMPYEPDYENMFFEEFEYDEDINYHTQTYLKENFSINPKVLIGFDINIRSKELNVFIHLYKWSLKDEKRTNP